MSLFYIFITPALQGGDGGTATGISFNHDIPIQEFRLGGGGFGAIQARDERCGGISVPVVWSLWCGAQCKVAEVVSIQPSEQIGSGAFARRGEARRARGNGDPGFTRLRACSFFSPTSPPPPCSVKKGKKRAKKGQKRAKKGPKKQKRNTV